MAILALTVVSKSPPGLDHVVLLNEEWIHVASPAAGAVPPPSPLGACDVPSVQSLVSRRSCTVPLLDFGVFSTRRKTALVTIASLGTEELTSK